MKTFNEKLNLLKRKIDSNEVITIAIFGLGSVGCYLLDYLVYACIAIVTAIGVFKCLLPLWNTTHALRKAIRKLQDDTVDLILCSHNLGDEQQDGQHLLEDLRTNALITRQTLFFILYDSAHQQEVVGAADLSPDGVLVKPFTAHVLQSRHFTTADGLASNTVRKIIQDSYGFLWFCTNNGISTNSAIISNECWTEGKPDLLVK